MYLDHRSGRAVLSARCWSRRFVCWFSLLLLLPGASPALFAAATTPEQAKAVVTGWLKLDNAPLGTALGQQIKAVQTYKDEAGATAYYIVNLEPSGFVVISADDLIEPIIGFVKAGAYDPSSANPLGALVSQDMKARMAAAKTAAAVRGAAGRAIGATQAQKKWASLSAQAKASVASRGLSSISDLRVGALLDLPAAGGPIRWDQQCVPRAANPANGIWCYNWFTPEHYVSGCVATAMAQLMRYHRYPVAGVGRLAYSASVDGTPHYPFYLRGGDDNGGPYAWGDMPGTPDANTAYQQRMAIGRLCYDAGVATNMNWTSAESGTNTLTAADALKGAFQYSNAMKGFNVGGIPSQNLADMVCPNLDAGLPVLLGITGSDGGHAIVCDGYGYETYESSTLYHHLNMGWAGTADVWYALPDIDSQIQDADAPASFTVVYKCVYNIFPRAQSPYSELLSGRVTTAAGAPIPDAVMSLNGSPTTIATNARGIYVFRVAPNVAFTVTASKTGYGFTSKTVTVGKSVDGRSDTGNRWGVDLEGSDAPPPAPTISGISPSSGPLVGGTSVTITGTNFTGATDVAFGSVSVDAASFTVNSATQITATTPAQETPGAVSVAVTVPGATVTQANAFTYTAPAAQPYIYDISPYTGPLAGGTTVTITGDDFATTGTVVVEFGDAAATSVTVNTATQITCKAPSHAFGTVDVKVVNPDGQSDTLFMAYTYRDATALTKDVPVNGNSSSGQLYYYFDVPAGVTQVKITTTTTVADDILDLGVNGPVWGDYSDDVYATDLCSYTYSGNETVVFNTAPVQAGRYYILVARVESGPAGVFSITATYTLGSTVPAPVVDFLISGNGVTTGGSYIWVCGSNFATVGNVTVTFDGIAATDVFVEADATTIYCTTPAHAAGAVDVKVTNPDGQSVTLSQGFTYTGPQALTKDVPVNGSTVSGDVPYYFDVPAGVGSVIIQINNTSGDILDMAVNGPAAGNWPSDPYTGDISAATDSGDEMAEFTTPPMQSGRYYILVGQWLDGGAFTITATYSAPAPVITYAWGLNATGQVGDGTLTDRYTPVQVAGLSSVTAVAGGSGHSLALKTDGTAWAWGDNQLGQLGDGTTTQRNAPVQVTGVAGVIAIEGGNSHSLALKTDGTVWAWGYNVYGQLGDGSTTDRSAPVQVTGLSGATAIAAGYLHSVALKTDGTVWAWGLNEHSQIGDATITNRSTPVQVTGLTGVTAIAGGYEHCLALRNDGTVWAWGYNWAGELGDGTTTERNAPVQVAGLSEVAAIAAGKGYHSLALKADGTVWAWGFNVKGQLGDGTTTSRSTPIQVTGLSNVAAIGAGIQYSLAIRNDGILWAWGLNKYGQLGDGTTTDRYTPVQVTGLGSVTAVAEGAGHCSLALTAPPAITSPAAAIGTVGQPFSYTVTAGGRPPITFSAAPLPPGLTLSGTTISGTPSAEGVTDVTLGANNGAGSDSKVLRITIYPAPPTITSALTATVTVGSQFSYTITASGTEPIAFGASPLPEGLVLSGGTISGIPTEIGTFTINLTASNSAGTDTKVLVIQVNAIAPPPGSGPSQSNLDGDGDGFPDEIETALGSSLTKATSTPFGWPAASAPAALLLPKLKVALNFAKGGSDSIQISGVLPVRAGFVAASQPVVVDVGGVVKTFTLDPKGNGIGATNARFKLQVKAKKGVVSAQNAKFSAKLGKADFASLLGDEGLTNADLKDASRTIPVIILFDQTVFRTDVTVLYTAKLNKTGRTKQPR